MRKNFLNLLALLAFSSAGSTNAGIIDPASVLLNETGANFLESQLGLGDLNWDSIWYGSQGATSSSWHSAVDGVSNTISIYDITYNDSNYLIGGYNALAWGSENQYVHDHTDGTFENFLFNLTGQFIHNDPDPHASIPVGFGAIYNHPDYFATFGIGHDLYGGRSTIGSFSGYSHRVGTYNGESDTGLGNIVTETNSLVSFRVNALETFTFESATVPLPTTFALFSLGLTALVCSRRKRVFK